MLGMNIITSSLPPFRGYGRCEQIFTDFFRFEYRLYRNRTQSTPRPPPEVNLVHNPFIVRLSDTPRSAPGPGDARL